MSVYYAKGEERKLLCEKKKVNTEFYVLVFDIS